MAEKLSVAGNLSGKKIDSLIGSATALKRQTTLDFSGVSTSQKAPIIPGTSNRHNQPRVRADKRYRLPIHRPLLPTTATMSGIWSNLDPRSPERYQVV